MKTTLQYQCCVQFYCYTLMTLVLDEIQVGPIVTVEQTKGGTMEGQTSFFLF